MITIRAAVKTPLICLSFLALLAALVATSPAAFAQNRKPGAITSYDEKKRQANDIAVTVVVSGISCTCARFAEDIRNVVNDLGPDKSAFCRFLALAGCRM